MGQASQSRTPDIQIFRDIFNSSPIGIAVESVDGQPLFVNPAFCAFLGFSEEEVRHKHCVDFSPREDAEKDWALFQQLKAGSIDRYQLEKRYFRRDGSLVWGRLSISLLNRHSSPLVLAMVEDVTEKKKTEEVLREGEERLRLAAQAGRMFAYSWDAATDVIERSGESAEILGIKKEEAATGAAVAAMVHPDDKQRLEDALANLTLENPRLQIIYRIIRPDGRVRWLERNSRAYFDDQGKVKRVIGMIVDATEQKQAEDRLREYERAVESSGEMIAVVDRNYRFLLANNQFVKMRNMTSEQVVGHFVNEVLNKDFFETVVKPKLDECFGGKVVKYETKRSYPEVGERDLVVSYFPIEAARGIDRVACIMHDITDRKRAEEALLEMNRTLEAQGSVLRSREELLKVFVKNVPAAVAMLDREMRYLQVSDRWCSDYLPDRTQILGRSHYEIFPDMPERWKEVHRRALQGETLRADEDHWDGQDGPHWARWEVRPWKTAEGAVGGILILAEDIGPRKQMEEELLHMSRKLIQSQEQERARIGRELHDDINQQLALLAADLQQVSANPSQSYVADVQKRVLEIADDVQSLSHELHSSKLEYLGVVAGIKSWCKEFGERQKMEIQFSGNVVTALPQEIGVTLLRILQEALHNALKHSGVRRVEVQLREVSDEIHLVVSDRGRGFEAEAALRGEGLGLTSMRERVRLINGTISIDSKPMGGTTIRVRVPSRSVRPSQTAAGRGEPSPGIHG